MNWKKQAGMNSALLMFILVMSGFLLMLAFHLVPPYASNRYVVSALKSLAESHPDDLGTMTKAAIRQELSKFYMVNNVRGDAATALEVTKTQEKTIITIAYEVRKPFTANIDTVVKFENVLDSSKPEECCSVSKK